MPAVTADFGYYPKNCDICVGDISITNAPDLAVKIEGVSKGPGLYEGWIHAPRMRMQGLFRDREVVLPIQSRVFGLPKTHTLTHASAENEAHMQFLIWCFSLFVGMRLTTTEAGFMDATPITTGKLTDFGASEATLKRGLALANEFWIKHSSNRNAKRVCAAIHALFIAQYPQSLCYERFMHLYIALDACFALAQDIIPTISQTNHAGRIEWMCKQFGMPLPEWAAQSSPKSPTELSKNRNDSFHEALFFDEPLGFSIYGGNTPTPDRGNVTLEMEALICRLLIALLGRPDCDYVKSSVTSRQRYWLEL
jgi:hypothetical protein